MSFFKPRKFVSVIGQKSAVPDGLWMKCAGCKRAIFRTDVEKNQEVCPACGHHYRIGARQRIEWLVDPGTFEETHGDIVPGDPLGFVAHGESYAERLARAEKESGLKQALLTGFARIESAPTVLAAVDWRFIMGSMSSALGEKFARATQDAIRERLPFVCFAASGGARMHEGTLGLMQMVKTADSVRAMNEAGIPFISVLTDPTSGGMFASFASLGDIVIAEPGAYIGFAGQRLIEGALGVKVPKGFQRTEYQFENGFVDAIVARPDMRRYLARLIAYLMPPRPSDSPPPAPPAGARIQGNTQDAENGPPLPVGR